MVLWDEFIPSFGLWYSYGILGKYFPLLFKFRQNNRQVIIQNIIYSSYFGLGILIDLIPIYGLRFPLGDGYGYGKPSLNLYLNYPFFKVSSYAPIKVSFKSLYLDKLWFSSLN